MWLVKIFNLFSHNRQRILYNYTQCSTVDSRHTYTHACRYIQSVWHKLHVYACEKRQRLFYYEHQRSVYLCFTHHSLMLASNRNANTVCAYMYICLCVCRLSLFYISTVAGWYAECSATTVQNPKFYSFFGIKRNRNIITVIINKRVGIQHTRASPSAILNKNNGFYRVFTFVTFFCASKYLTSFKICIWILRFIINVNIFPGNSNFHLYFSCYCFNEYCVYCNWFV